MVTEIYSNSITNISVRVSADAKPDTAHERQ